MHALENSFQNLFAQLMRSMSASGVFHHGDHVEPRVGAAVIHGPSFYVGIDGLFEGQRGFCNASVNVVRVSVAGIVGKGQLWWQEKMVKEILEIVLRGRHAAVSLKAVYRLGERAADKRRV